MSTIEMVAIGKLVVADDNVRTDVGDVTELAASIKAGGVIAPLVVREGDYVVVAGSRRLAAAKKAGLKQVPAIVRAFTDQERVEVMLVENLQREDLTPLEEASGFARLSEMGLSQKQVAERVGCSQTHVSRRLGLLALPFAVQMTVNKGAISSEEATELVKLKDEPELVEAIVKRKEAGGTYAPAVAQTVRRELEKKARQKKVAAELKKQTKNGRNAVALNGDEYGHYVAPPEGFALVVAEAFRSNEVEVDPEAHSKMECSAVGIRPNDASLVELCSCPSNHPSPAEKRKAEDDQRRAEAAAAKQAWQESIERRREFVGGYVRGKVATDVAIRLAWIVIAESSSLGWYGAEDEEEIACELLGIALTQEVVVGNDLVEGDEVGDEAKFDEEGDGTVSLDASDELARLASGTNADRVRALAAIGAARLEICASNAYGRWGHGEKAYVELLKTLGYEPAAPELEELLATVE